MLSMQICVCIHVIYGGTVCCVLSGEIISRCAFFVQSAGVAIH